jgi:spermidine synthase
VELDPQLLATVRKYLSAEGRQALADPRVQVFPNLDGRLFVKRTRQPFDVILVCLPDPSTAQLNRFYTLEFCRKARRALRPEGVLALRLASGENYLSPETQLLNACLARTLRQAFADVVVLPGETALFLACPSPGILTTRPEVLVARFRQRRLQPKYLTEYDFTLRLMPERMEWLRARLEQAPRVKLNRDFFPICYYYHWLRWTAQFSRRDEASGRRAERLLALAEGLRVEWFALPLALVGIGRLLRRRRRPRRPHRMVAWTLFCSGFGGMALEMLLVFAFQSLYGYVYSQVGLLIAAFMLGLFLGTYGLNRLLAGPSRMGLPTLARLQLALTLYALALPLLLEGLGHLRQQFLLVLVAQGLFPLLVALAGLLVGAQFPLASSLCLQAEGATAGRIGGSLYAADLLGGCGGALLVSALLLPLLGVFQTCLGTALLLASAVVGLGFREPPAGGCAGA